MKIKKILCILALILTVLLLMKKISTTQLFEAFATRNITSKTLDDIVLAEMNSPTLWNVYNTSIGYNQTAESTSPTYSKLWRVSTRNLTDSKFEEFEVTDVDVDHDTQFSIADYFSFPHPGGALKKKMELLNSVWVKDLRQILHTRWNDRNKLIFMVSSNYQYITVLLNWLIATVSAKIDLDRILVISLDRSTHSLLQARGISSVLVQSSSLFLEHVTPSLWMTRLVIIRLLNHWKFDVAHFDADALIVRNPEPLFRQFNESDIIGSQGLFPSALSHKWGATICAGVMVIKSGKETEDYWQAMGTILRKSLSDQERLNYALESLHIQWHHPNREVLEGQCGNGLRVTLLSHSHVCRSNCRRSELGSYYVWHKTGKKNSDTKRKTATDGRLWMVRDDWNTKCTGEDLKRLGWLDCLALS